MFKFKSFRFSFEKSLDSLKLTVQLDFERYGSENLKANVLFHIFIFYIYICSVHIYTGFAVHI